MRKLRSTLMTGAAIGAAAIGGAAIANAATSATTTTSSGSSPAAHNQSPAFSPSHAGPGLNPSRGGHTVNGKTEKLLSGDVAAKVRAAALAKVSGTVERVETNVDDTVPYEAHIVKSDGTQVIVEVNGDYTVASVHSMGPGH